MPDQKISQDPLLASPTTSARVPMIDPGTDATKNYQVAPAGAKTWLAVGSSDLSATGTRDATSFLRGDNTWAVPPGGSGVAGYSSGVPYLLRGTVSANLYPGVTTTTGLNQAARQANLTAINAAIAYASTNKKYIDFDPGTYEIEGAGGVTFPAGQWNIARGHDANFKQYSTNTPVMCIGTQTGTTETADQFIDGFRVQYGVAQTGLTGSIAVSIGRLYQSTIDGIKIDGYTDPPYDAIGTVNGFVFSNIFRKISINGAQRSLFRFKNTGTGNVFENIYMSAHSAGGPMSLTGPAFQFSEAQAQYGNVFNQLNIEWVRANQMIRLVSTPTTVINSLHFEGVEMLSNGASDNPNVIFLEGSSCTINAMTMLDTRIHTTQGGTGTSATVGIFGGYLTGGATVNGLCMMWADGSTRVDRPWRIVNPDGLSGWAAPNIVVNNFLINGAQGTFNFDSNMIAANFPTPMRCERFASRDMVSEVQSVYIETNANMTVYAQLKDPFIRYPATLTAARTVTLSNASKATGTGASIPPRVGSLVTVRRDSGTADAFNLVVNNHNGSTLSTISTANTAARYRFDGTNWVVVT